MEVAQKIRETNKEMYLIFTTAHLEYAMIAYKVKTFDYIAKPLTLERLEETVERLFNDIFHAPANYLKLDNGKLVINKKDINYIKRNGMKLTFYTGSRDYESYTSFTKIQNQLSNDFVRCHKSYMVNLNNISRVEMSNNIIVLKDNSICYIGPKYKNEFMEVFKNHESITNYLVSANNAQYANG